MKKILLTMFLGISLMSQLNAQKVQILPIPQQVSAISGILRIDRKFEVKSNADYTKKTTNAIARLINNWEKKTLKRIVFQQTNQSDFEISIDPTWAGKSNSVEEYELIIDTKIFLKAKSESGLLHGLESLSLLIQSDEVGYLLPKCMISDWPRFAHRGLMIDVARHFIPLPIVLRSIDGMAASKMNVLHLHLSDDEGFRIESKQFPNLHLKGSKGEFFTQEEIRKLVTYADERGIVVIPEFDLPGHSQSWFVGYPELASEKKEYQLGPRFIIEEGKPMNPMALTQMLNSQATPTINPADEKTYQFLGKFFKEMVGLFPGPYFHVGMDENNGVSWKKNPSIQAFMKSKKIANEHDLQAYFGERLNQIVHKLGKKTVMWEEGFHQNLSEDVVVQLWKPALMGKVLQAEDAARANHKVIVSRGFYLDYFMPAAFHYGNAEIVDLKNDDWILGGEAAIWTELVDQQNFELRIWPRAISVASRLWSSKNEKDIEKFYEFLPAFDAHLSSLGLEHRIRSENQLATLLNGNLTDADQQFFQAVAPARGFKRLIGDMTKPNSQKFTHFNAFADVLPSDSYVKWQFRQLVKSYLENPSNVNNRSLVVKQLQIWSDFNSYIESRTKTATHLKNLEPLAKQISMCAQMLVDYLNNSTAIEKSKLLSELTKLKKMNIADLECVVSDELESIVNGKLKEIDLKLSLF